MPRRDLTLEKAKENIEGSMVFSNAFDDAVSFARRRLRELGEEASQWRRLVETAEHRERNAVGGYPG